MPNIKKKQKQQDKKREKQKGKKLTYEDPITICFSIKNTQMVGGGWHETSRRELLLKICRINKSKIKTPWIKTLRAEKSSIL